MTNLFSLCCGCKPQEVQAWRDPWYAFQLSCILSSTGYEHTGVNVYNVIECIIVYVIYVPGVTAIHYLDDLMNYLGFAFCYVFQVRALLFTLKCLAGW